MIAFLLDAVVKANWKWININFCIYIVKIVVAISYQYLDAAISCIFALRVPIFENLNLFLPFYEIKLIF